MRTRVREKVTNVSFCNWESSKSLCIAYIFLDSDRVLQMWKTRRRIIAGVTIWENKVKAHLNSAAICTEWWAPLVNCLERIFWKIFLSITAWDLYLQIWLYFFSNSIWISFKVQKVFLQPMSRGGINQRIKNRAAWLALVWRPPY